MGDTVYIDGVGKDETRCRDRTARIVISSRVDGSKTCSDIGKCCKLLMGLTVATNFSHCQGKPIPQVAK